MSTIFIRFLDEISFFFEKLKKIEDSPLEIQADGQPSHNPQNHDAKFQI